MWMPYAGAITRQRISHVHSKMVQISVQQLTRGSTEEWSALTYYRFVRSGPDAQGNAPPTDSGPCPNHNAECEQFQGTMVQECRHPDFHRHFSSVRRLQAEADARLTTYTTAGATTATTCVDIPLTRFSTPSMSTLSEADRAADSLN